MPGIEAWHAFAGVASIIILLGGLALALQRLGIIQPRAKAAATGRIEEIEKVMTDLRIEIARDYISREDWVPMTSRILGMLERHGEALARLEAQIEAQRERPT